MLRTPLPRTNATRQCRRQALDLLDVGLAWLLIVGADTPAAAELRGDGHWIDRVCVAYEENLAKLRTWTAEVEVRDRGSDTPLFQRRDDRFVVTWLYDRDLPAYRVMWRCVQSSGVREGKDIGGWNTGAELAELFTGGTIYRIPVYFASKDGSPRSAKESPPDGPAPKTLRGPNIVTGEPSPRKPVGNFEERLVPQELFWLRGVPLSDKVRQWVRYAQQLSEVIQCDVAAEGDLVTIRVSHPANSETAVVDIAKGGLLVQWQTQGEKMSEGQQIEPACINGVWVPTHIRRWHSEQRSGVPEGGSSEGTGSRMRLERDLIWRVNRVNEPIPESEFTVEALRAGRPATITDFKTLAVTRVGPSGEELPARGAAARQAKPGARWGVGFLAAVGLPLALLAYYGWRRLRRQ